jgi:hypothetical protein
MKRRGDRVAAVAALEQAVGLLASLDRDHPGVPEYVGRLAGAEINLGWALVPSDATRSLAMIDSGIEHARAAMDANPGNRLYLDYLVNGCTTRGKYLIRSGDLEGAASVVESMAAEFASFGKASWEGGSLLAIAAHFAAGDTRERYAARAVELLSAGWLLGHGSSAQLRTVAFQALQDRVAFRSLIDELRAAGR